MTEVANNHVLLHTEGLVKIYGGRRVVDGVDINVKRSEVVGLLGPNGAGKTTTFYMTVGLVKPDGGKVFFDTSDSSLYHVLDANSGKRIVRQQGKAWMFSSPAVALDVVFIGVLNGTLEARDLKSGDLLRDFQVEKSTQNKNWVLTGDRKFNVPFLFHSNWREAPLVANDQQIRIGGIYSSPLVANGVVYFGSADGFLYALE